MTKYSSSAVSEASCKPWQLTEFLFRCPGSEMRPPWPRQYRRCVTQLSREMAPCKSQRSVWHYLAGTNRPDGTECACLGMLSARVESQALGFQWPEDEKPVDCASKPLCFLKGGQRLCGILKLYQTLISLEHVQEADEFHFHCAW